MIPISNMQVKIISIVVLCLLIFPCAMYAQSAKNLKSEKLTEAEIKEAERIFATFKKRLEATNDLRIALRGIPAGNWFKNLYIADVWVLSGIIPGNNSLVLKNINAYRQFYLNLLTISRIIGLYTATLSPNNSYDSKKALAAILRKVPVRERKSIKLCWATIEGDLKFNTNLKKVIQATRMLNTAIEIVGKDLSRLRRERPSEYQNALQQINIYNDETPSEETCDEDGFYGLKKGTNYLFKIEGGYTLMVGRVNRRIGILAIEIYAQ